MKFLVDHQLPPAIADFFRERGHDSQHLLEIGMASSSDLEVYEYAVALGFIIVTKDEDFLYLSHRFGSDAGCCGFGSGTAALGSRSRRSIGSGLRLSAASLLAIALSRFADR